MHAHLHSLCVSSSLPPYSCFSSLPSRCVFIVFHLSLPVGINPRGLGCHDPRFLDGSMRGSWGIHEILSYPIVYRNMRWEHLPRVMTFGNRKICIHKLNENSGDDTLNPVLCTSVFWIFRTQDTHSFHTSTNHTTSFKTRTLARQTPRVLKPDWRPYHSPHVSRGMSICPSVSLSHPFLLASHNWCYLCRFPFL